MRGLWFYANPTDRQHHEALERDRLSKFINLENCQHLALERKAVNAVTYRLAGRGYRVSPTPPNAPFDLWVEGVKVEVKASTWRDHQTNGGGRYQANIRNCAADILIFDCINGTHHFHIIPMAAIAARHNLAVWSYNPARSKGLWVNYLEAWGLLDEIVYLSKAIYQPTLSLSL